MQIIFMLYTNNMLTDSIYVTYSKNIQTALWQMLFIHLQSNDTNSSLTNSIYVTYRKILTRASHGLSISFLSNQRLHAWSWINRTFLGNGFFCANFGFECSWPFPFLVFFSVRWTSHQHTGSWLAIKGRGPL